MKTEKEIKKILQEEFLKNNSALYIHLLERMDID
jgi:hypothetical protein